MPFCTHCGGRIGDEARFCPSCGNPAAGAAAGAGPGAGAAPFKLDYQIQGDNLQVARLKLRPGQEVYAEAGKMVYKTPAVQWETRMSGQSFGEKIFGAIKRKLMGESLFLTYFKAFQDGEVGFAGSYPGKLQAVDLPAGKSILAQRDSL